jgi:hypothetical protein
MDKFLLAENPMRPDDESGPFIIHMLEPISIIRCIPGHHQMGKIFRHYDFMNGDSQLESWTLSIYHLFTADMLEKPEDRALKLLDRAWRWYRSYMEWEDKIQTDD